jgi:hypothetical protein
MCQGKERGVGSVGDGGLLHRCVDELDVAPATRDRARSRARQHVEAEVDSKEPSLGSNAEDDGLEVETGSASHVDDDLATPQLQELDGPPPVPHPRTSNYVVDRRESSILLDRSLWIRSSIPAHEIEPSSTTKR